MSHRNSPPRQSRVQRIKRQPVTAHVGMRAPGHNVGTRKPVILDKQNGRFYGGARPVAVLV